MEKRTKETSKSVHSILLCHVCNPASTLGFPNGDLVLSGEHVSCILVTERLFLPVSFNSEQYITIYMAERLFMEYIYVDSIGFLI